MRKDCVENAPEGYVKIMLELQSEKVEDRPSFSVLRDWLEKTLRSEYGDVEETLSIKISSSSSSSLPDPVLPQSTVALEILWVDKSTATAVIRTAVV